MDSCCQSSYNFMVWDNFALPFYHMFLTFYRSILRHQSKQTYSEPIQIECLTHSHQYIYPFQNQSSVSQLTNFPMKTSKYVKLKTPVQCECLTTQIAWDSVLIIKSFKKSVPSVCYLFTGSILMRTSSPHLSKIDLFFAHSILTSVTGWNSIVLPSAHDTTFISRA
jgi:hypothetical protein